jgi:Ca2+-binding EF-hand superfamily protein
MLLLAFAGLTTFNCEDLVPADANEQDIPPLPHDEPPREVTREHMEKLYNHIDGDEDGKVNIQEILKFNQIAMKHMAAKEIEAVFHEMESTKDGHLSLEEHMSETFDIHRDVDASESAKIFSHEEAKFKAADLNSDGKLDKTEFVNLVHPHTHPEVHDIHATERMRKTDVNGDGKISSEEWEEEHISEGSFDQADENKDGIVDKDELKHYESGHLDTKIAMTKLLEDADEDGDKHFTKAEFAKFADKLEAHPAENHIMEWVLNYLGEGARKDEM